MSNRYQQSFDAQKTRSHSLRSEPVSERIKRIKAIEKWTLRHRQDIIDAVSKDIGKPQYPADISEVFTVTSEARLAYRNLQRWSRPVKVDTPITQLGTRARIHFEPKGVCLLISTWNFPFNLTIIPLISCLAAGNTAIIKPSEFSRNTSLLISRMCSELFETDIVQVISGDKEVAAELLDLPFDHIFFTGSTAVGRVVMRAAAKHLSGITLELGGKNPTLIASDANLKDAAKKIVWGKFLNCGQSCVAPDYVLVPKSKSDDLVELLQEQIEQFYVGEIAASSFGRIINHSHWDRLHSLLEHSQTEGLKVTYFGKPDRESCFMPPVIVQGTDWNSHIMLEEIFGPILPIVEYDDFEQEIDKFGNHHKPLAVYLFTRSRKVRKLVETGMSSGALVINDVVIQFANKNLPFGGVNNSGSGSAHGHYGFKEFSHQKPILRQRIGKTTIQLFYPPYTGFKRKIIDLVVKYLG